MPWKLIGNVRGQPGVEGPKGDRVDVGPKGDRGDFGPIGAGVPAGGAVDALIQKSGAADYQTEWREFLRTHYVELPTQNGLASPPAGTGRLRTRNVQGLTALEYEADGQTFRLLRDNAIIVRNSLATTINRGQAVDLKGTEGEIPLAQLAKADSPATMPAIGLAAQDIAAGGYGRVITWGKVTGQDTSAYTEGDQLYVSATTAGALTKTRPAAPRLVQPVSHVIGVGVADGVLSVEPAGIEPIPNVYIQPTQPPAGTPTPYLWVDISGTGDATLWVEDGVA